MTNLNQHWPNFMTSQGDTRPHWIISLWPCDTRWRHRSRSTLVQAMACCWMATCTVGTPYNTNVGVQKIPDSAIWKPVVAKRNNTNPWSCPEPQILVTRDSRQLHMVKQLASRDRLESISPFMHSSQTAWQLFNLGQSIEIRIPPLLGSFIQMYFTHLTLFLRVVNNKSLASWAIVSSMRTHSETWHRPFTVSFMLRLRELPAEPSGSARDRVAV